MIAAVDGAAYSTNSRVEALPTGSDHVVVWNAGAVFPAGTQTNVLLRARAQDVTLMGEWSTPVSYAVVIQAGSDSDSDGLPDDWEIEKLHTLAYGPNDDPDHDGFKNWQEYVADTDPLDANSYLHFTGVSRVPGAVRLDWLGGELATQFLQRRLSLDVTNEWQDILTNAPAPRTPISGSHTDSATNAIQFYRLKATR
jgi:hypothetical protein